MQSLDFGARFVGADGVWKWSGNATFSNWNNLQSDYILTNGLLGTRNAGDALLFGMGMQGEYNLTAALSLTAGFNWQHARLERPAAWLVGGHEYPLPVVPPIKAHGGIVYRFPLGNWDIQAAGRVDYQGRRLFGHRPPNQPEQWGFCANVHKSCGAEWAMAGINVGIDNVLNSRADTFPYGNSFAIQETPQYTPVKPRTVRLALRYNW